MKFFATDVLSRGKRESEHWLGEEMQSRAEGRQGQESPQTVPKVMRPDLKIFGSLSNTQSITFLGPRLL